MGGIAGLRGDGIQSSFHPPISSGQVGSIQFRKKWEGSKATGAARAARYMCIKCPLGAGRTPIKEGTANKEAGEDA